ncbi:lipopolysaccharide biosynthesis protein [Pseudomonas protegens]|uniref:lipopolysaccharide biosynthesis protein n=1 Tax=Pseudomonas protegens TaxID=380021 RepID=UPI000641C08B|nr:oligosaccharide flippase family protein [Pseudomonas protegens]
MKRGGYLWHLALSMGTRLAMIGLRLLRNVLLARLLGPADRGLFALLSTLPDLIAALTSGGLNTAVGYEAARQRPMGLLLTQVLVYGCLLASLLTLAGLALMNTLGSQWELSLQLGDLAWLLLLAVPITVLKSGLLTLHNADGRVEAFNALRLLESLVPLLLFVGLWWIWRDQPLSAALVSWLGGTLLVVVVGWCWLRRFHDLGLRWQAGEQGKLLRYSAQSHPGVLSQQLMLRSDYLFIGALLDPAALGWYAMASAAAELLLIIPEAVTTPLMKRLLQQGSGIEQLTALALRLTATVMLGACLCMALIGQWLIVTLFGADYAPAYGALLALLPGLFGLCYASILRLDLLGKQRPGTLSLLLAGGALLNLALNALLIPSLGIVGAGLASSIAYLAVSLAMLGLYCHLSGVAWYRTLILLPADIVYVRQLLRPKERLQ